MKSLYRSAGFAGMLALSACVVSEGALFTADNASATPISAGRYDACSGSDDGDEVECNPMTVSLGENGAYVFLVEDDQVDARLLQIDEDDFAVQLSESGDDFQYYWGRVTEGSLTLVMLWCQDLPKALVEKLVQDGAMEADEERQTCTAKTPSAVVVAAKSYIAGEASGEKSWVKLTPASAPQ